MERMEDLSDTLNKETENQSEMKNSVTEIKNTYWGHVVGINTRLEEKEQISKLENSNGKQSS